VAGWESKGQALLFQGRSSEALGAFRTALELAPERELSLAGAAAAAQEVQQLGPALGYWRRAAAVNPWSPTYRSNLATLLSVSGDWDEAGRQCRAWRELEPGSVEGRMLWVRYLLRAGRTAEARAEFAQVRALRPDDLGLLEAWFSQVEKSAAHSEARSPKPETHPKPGT
jgi:tetratricopeptide (TPR) repeat protein